MIHQIREESSRVLKPISTSQDLPSSHTTSNLPSEPIDANDPSNSLNQPPDQESQNVLNFPSCFAGESVHFHLGKLCKLMEDKRSIEEIMVDLFSDQNESKKSTFSKEVLKAMFCAYTYLDHLGLKCCEKSEELLKQVSDQNDPSYLRDLIRHCNHSGDIYTRFGRFQQAEGYLKTSRELIEKLKEDTEEDLRWVNHAEAWLLLNEGQKIFFEARELMDKIFQRQKYDEALEKINQAEEKFRELDSEGIVQCYNRKIYLLIARNEREEAGYCIGKVLKKTEELEESHFLHGWIFRLQAKVLLMTKANEKEAADLEDKGMQILRKSLPKESSLLSPKLGEIVC